MEKLGITNDVSLKIWPSWGEKEPPVFPNEAYLELAKEKPLIVFDSLIRFYPKGIDENSSTDMAGVMGFFRSLTKAGATILILHHKGKGESSDYRGSSDIHGGVDIAYSVKKTDNSPILTLKCFKSRFNIEKDIPVEIISDDYSLRFEDASGKMEQEREQAKTEKMESLRELIEELRNPNQTELIKKANEVLGISEHTIRPMLQKGEGKLWVSGGGGKGKPIHYKSLRVTSEPPQPIYSSAELRRLEDPQGEIVIEGVRA